MSDQELLDRMATWFLRELDARKILERELRDLAEVTKDPELRERAERALRAAKAVRTL